MDDSKPKRRRSSKRKGTPRSAERDLKYALFADALMDGHERIRALTMAGLQGSASTPERLRERVRTVFGDERFLAILTEKAAERREGAAREVKELREILHALATFDITDVITTQSAEEFYSTPPPERPEDGNVVNLPVALHKGKGTHKLRPPPRVVPDERGNIIGMKLIGRDLNKLSRVQRLCIKALRQRFDKDEGPYIEIEFYDRMEAIKLLGTSYGMFAKELERADEHVNLAEEMRRRARLVHQHTGRTFDNEGNLIQDGDAARRA